MGTWNKLSLAFPSPVREVYLSQTSTPSNQVTLYIHCFDKKDNTDSGMQIRKEPLCHYGQVSMKETSPTGLPIDQGYVQTTCETVMSHGGIQQLERELTTAVKVLDNRFGLSLESSGNTNSMAWLQQLIASSSRGDISNNPVPQGHPSTGVNIPQWLAAFPRPKFPAKPGEGQVTPNLSMSMSSVPSPFAMPQSPAPLSMFNMSTAASECDFHEPGSPSIAASGTSSMQVTTRRIVGYKLCPICRVMKCRQYKQLISHVQMHHHIPLTVDQLQFDNASHFVTWKHHIEKQTNTNYVQKCGVSDVKHSMNSYFICNRSNRKSRTNSDTASSVRSSLSLLTTTDNTTLLSATCTAFIRTAQSKETGKISVMFCSTHLGHT